MSQNALSGRPSSTRTHGELYRKTLYSSWIKGRTMGAKREGEYKGNGSEGEGKRYQGRCYVKTSKALNETPSHSHRRVTCYNRITQCYLHPTQVNTPRLNPSQRPVLDFPTPEGWKAELSYGDG